MLSERLEETDSDKGRQQVNDRRRLGHLLVGQLKVVGDGAESDEEAGYQGLMTLEVQVGSFAATAMPLERGICCARG